jgi:hypothetical protein
LLKIEKRIKKEVIKMKVEILADISQEGHVNVQWRLPLPTPPPRKRIKLPQPQPPMDLYPQLYRLLKSAHYLLNSTKPTLAEDCWIVSLQASHRYWQFLWIHLRPHQVINPPLTRPNITNIETNPSCSSVLKVYRGQFHWGKFPKTFA